MRPIIDMETVQIEITNACGHQCSNCTRLVGHHPKPYFMDFDTFKNAVDSMAEFPSSRIVGMMGGEPLLHPEFERFCKYMQEKLGPDRCGLWTCFPEGKEHYRQTVVDTFGNIFLNDHTRADVLHGPVLVASEELDMYQWYKDYRINHCWVQNTWSASINPHGAFFCEVAAALSMLLETQETTLGWKVEPDWWKRSPKDFTAQMERYCVKCGCAMPLMRRESTDGRDDISPKMLELLRKTSPKLKRGKYVKAKINEFHEDNRPTATYKDQEYRDKIAARYGIFLALRDSGYLKPHLIQNQEKAEDKSRELAPV